MFKTEARRRFQYSIFLPAVFLIAISLFVLNSLSYLTTPYIVFVVLAFAAYFIFSSIDYEILELFSKYFYVICIILLLLPIFIGSATRGTIRWIPLGSFTIQPAEIVRPFLLVFFANYLSKGKRNFARVLKGGLLFVIPTFLILIQPSLGVTLLTTVGFLGIFLASGYPRKYYLLWAAIILVSIPLAYGLLANYQRQRIVAFMTPGLDPQGAGYNSVQALISVGSGRLTGKGLGHGIQTQLAFLPERHSDFIFASISEELGLLGAGILLAITFFLIWRFVNTMERTKEISERAFVAGFFLSFLAQVFVHVGMNLSMLPITGVPYPLVSAGGSSLVATMIGLGMVASIRNHQTKSL